MGGTEEQHGIGPLISQHRDVSLEEGRAGYRGPVVRQGIRRSCALYGAHSTQLKIALL